MQEIGYFFCGNCGHVYNPERRSIDNLTTIDARTYEQKPDGECICCGFEEWIFEPTGEREDDDADR